MYYVFYVAQYPVRWISQSALHFTLGRPVHSDTNSTSLGSVSSYAVFTSEDFTHISTTVYYSQVLIYMAEWTGASWGERKCPNFEM